MASRRSGTIDSIKVGLGINMSQLDTDIKTMTSKINKDVKVDIGINQVSKKQADAWITSLETHATAKNAKRVRVPLEFDKEASLASFQTVIDAVEAQVKPIIVPVHFQNEADAASGYGGGSGPGGRPGGGGGGGAPSGGGKGPSGGATKKGAPASGKATSGATSSTADVTMDDVETPIEEIEALEKKLAAIEKALDARDGQQAAAEEQPKPKPFRRKTEKQKAAMSKAERKAYNKAEAEAKRAEAQEASRPDKGVSKKARPVEVPSADVYEVQGEEEPKAAPHQAARAAAKAAEEAGPDVAGRERVKASAKGKPLATKSGPLQMQESGGITSRDRAAAAARAAEREQTKESGRSDRGHQRDSSPGEPVFNKKTGKYELDMSRSRKDSQSHDIRDDVLSDLEGQTFGSTNEFEEAVRAAMAKRAEDKAEASSQPEGERKRRFDDLTPEKRRERQGEEKEKQEKILKALGDIETYTSRSGEEGITDKQRGIFEGRIQRGLESLEDVVPGLGEAFTERNIGKARVAVLNARIDAGELATPTQRANEQKRASRRFAEKSRTDMAEDLEDYPAEFAVETGMGSLFKEPSLKKADGIAQADESGRAPVPAKKSKTRGEAAREAEAVPYPKEAHDTVRRIRDIQRSRKNPLSEEARENFQPIDIIDVGHSAMPTAFGDEEKELKAANREIKTYENAGAKKAQIRSRGPEDEGGFSTPLPSTFEELDKAAEARKTAAKVRADQERRMTGRGRKKDRLKIDYSLEDLHAPMTERPFHERPVELTERNKQFALAGSQQPMSGSLFQLLSRGMAMGGALSQRLMAAKIQKAYDTGDFAEGQRLQKELEEAKGGWGEPELPMSPFMQLLRAKSLPGKDLTGRAMGGDVDDDEAWYSRRSRLTADAASEHYSDRARLFPSKARFPGAKRSFLEMVQGAERAEQREALRGRTQPPEFDDLAPQWNRLLDATGNRPEGSQGPSLDETAPALMAALPKWRNNATGGFLDRLFGRKPQQPQQFPRYDLPEPPMALRGGQALAKHGKGPMSPWVKDAIFNQLDPKDFTGKAMGGPSSSLSDLPGIAANAESITEVGEQGREAIVGLKGGGSFVVPNHQLGQFKKMVGMADGGPTPDDLWASTFGGRTGRTPTGAHSRNSRADGGQARNPVHYDPKAAAPPTGPWDWAPFGDVSLDPPPPPPPRVTNRGPKPGDEGAGLHIPGMGLGATGEKPGGGRYTYRPSYETSRGVADVKGLESGDAATLSTMSNDIQRVFVVNLPKGGLGAAGGTEPEERTERRKRTARVRGGLRSAPARGATGSGASVLEEDITPIDELEASLGADDPRAKHEKLKPPNRSTAEGSRAKFESERRISDLQERLDQVGINISEALQKSPVRALSVAMGQIAQTVVGGRAGILERSAQARAKGRRAGVALAELGAAEQQEFQLETFLESRTGKSTRREQEAEIAKEGRFSDEDRADLTKALENLTLAQERVAEVRPVAEARLSEAEQAAKGILTPGQQFRSQAVGLGGIVGGTLLFTTAMSAAQQGIQLLGEISSKAADYLSDFSFTAKATAKELGDAVKASSGQIETAISGYTASIGAPAGLDVSAVSRIAGISAGAESFQQQRDLMRSQRYYEGMSGGPTPGLGVGFGDGLFGTWIGQRQGIAEITASRFADTPRPVRAFEDSQFYPGVATIPNAGVAEVPEGFNEYRELARERYSRQQASGPTMGLPDSLLGLPEQDVDKFLDNFSEQLRSAFDVDFDKLGYSEIEDLLASNPDKIRQALEGAGSTGVAAIPDLEPVQRAIFQYEQGQRAAGTGGIPMETSTEQDARALYLEDEEEKLARVNRTAKELNLSLEKVGSGFEFVVDPKRAEEFRKVLESPEVGAGSYAGDYADRDIALVNKETGQTVDAYGATQGLQDLADSALAPTFESLLTNMRIPFQAQMDAQRRMFELQQQLIPTQTAQNLIANPFPKSATTGVIGTSGVDPAAEQAAGRWSGQIQRARDALAEIRADGLTELRNLGVPQKAIDDVTRLGTAITELQSQASDLQLGLEQAQFNEQIRISLRSIGDLVGLNQKQSMSIGDQVVGATKLGELQRAQINDSRELTRIQLARSQRELNLQIALSKLRSPGETPEERAVRRREAELMNRDQQRELDIGKRSSSRGFQIQDIELSRQLTDAIKQFTLLQEARDVSVQVRGIQQLVEAKQQMLAVKQAYLEVPKEAGVALRRASIGLIETLESKLDRITEVQVKAVNKYVTGMISEWDEFLDVFGIGGTKGGTKRSDNPSRSGKTQGDSGSSKFGERLRASGGIDRVSSPTRFVAGEAGTEEVIVLRNPRSGMGAPIGFNGGGGGGSFNLSMTINASVGNDGDEDRLVRKIVREIHQQAGMMAG